ncbi:hypothetical protein NC653_028715 [Populus alba x Populus x berolinensis]|uniref:Uncharacterized protein n=1 Tax=Populus alba x Populus x berolinensis TaxID=444605 RepID=A0AAD6M0Q4_9ROSI|nr:hypothetical protein NC653_028715 [Populus alba x Populus x berolinensis]
MVFERHHRQKDCPYQEHVADISHTFSNSKQYLMQEVSYYFGTFCSVDMNLLRHFDVRSNDELQSKGPEYQRCSSVTEAIKGQGAADKGLTLIPKRSNLELIMWILDAGHCYPLDLKFVEHMVPLDFFFISSILGGISGKLSYQTRANCWRDSRNKMVLLHSPTSLVEAFLTCYILKDTFGSV